MWESGSSKQAKFSIFLKRLETTHAVEQKNVCSSPGIVLLL